MLLENKEMMRVKKKFPEMPQCFEALKIFRVIAALDAKVFFSE